MHEVIMYSDSDGDRRDQIRAKVKMLDMYSCSYERNEHCQNCHYSHYYDDSDVETMICRRNPPVLLEFVCKDCKIIDQCDNKEGCYLRWDQPRVMDLFWCGEWKPKIAINYYEKSVTILGLCQRIQNIFEVNHIKTIKDLVTIDRGWLSVCKSMGKKSMADIENALKKYNLTLGMTVE